MGPDPESETGVSVIEYGAARKAGALEVEGITVSYGSLAIGRVVTSGPSAELAADDRVRRAYLSGHVGG